MLRNIIQNLESLINSSFMYHSSGINFQNIVNSYKAPLASPPFPSPPKNLAIKKYYLHSVSSPTAVNNL